jgi:hypothetical protein
MKLIERSAIGSKSSSIPFVDRAKGIWQFGLSWDRDTQAQQVLIQHLGNALDNSYTLVTNVPVPGFSVPVPLVLIGQTGLRTFCVSADKGIFSLKGEQWYKVDEQKQQYRPSRPNLVRRTAMMSRAIIEHLKEKGIYLDEGEATLFFTQPGVHIDAPESPVRLLQNDGIDRFTAILKNEDIVLDAMELQRITDILIKSKPNKSGGGQQQMPSRSTMSKYIGFGDFQLKAWQWIILFILAVFMLITVIVTAVIILNTA